MMTSLRRREETTTHARPSSEDRVPWDDRRRLGVGRAFVRTLVMSIREPTRFYGLRPSGAWPVVAAVLYGLAFDVTTALATFAYDKAFGEDALRGTIARIAPDLRRMFPRGPELLDGLVGASSIASLAVAPFSYALELLATAAVTWVGLRLTKNLRSSFSDLVRVFAYASWVKIFGLLSVSGDVSLSLLSFSLTLGFTSYYWLVAVRQSQGIDTRGAVYASLVGGLVAMALGCVVGVPAVIGLVAWAASSIDLPSLTPPP